MDTTTAWAVDDYRSFADGSGCTKIAASAVSPLVALARGMRSVHPGEVKELTTRLGVNPRSGAATLIKQTVGDSDALYMPWWTPENVVSMWRDQVTIPSPAPQFRPAPENMFVDPASGRTRKYVNLPGRALVIGPHPATPAAWLTSPAPHFLFTEGMMKADSALTAWLTHTGMAHDDHRLDAEELGLLDAGEFEQACWHARRRIATHLEQVPADQRVTIIGFVSVTTFQNRSEWVGLQAVPGSDSWVAFDGDTATNTMVWNNANDLFKVIERMKSTPHLLDLSPAAETSGDQHIGIDDYLAAGHTWDDLLSTAREQLPPRPVSDRTPGPGQWRMDNTTCQTLEWAAPTGPDSPGGWQVRHEFVARVKTIETRREVTPAELRGGAYNPTSTAAGQVSRAEVEVSWIDPSTREKVSQVVAGPDDILVETPNNWRRLPGVDAPAGVKSLVTWPPRDPDFLAAMKANRSDETLVRPLWSHMGWVPSMNGTPVFVVGDQVIGPHGWAPEMAACGVTNADLPTASRFGVQLPDSDEAARQALLEVLDLHRPADPARQVWRDQRNASIVLAAGVRPCAPTPTHVPIALTGSSGGGKTYTMAAVMAFWSAYPDAWSEDRLPGSANDTVASIEVALSMTPIWPVDDLPVSEMDSAGSNRKADAVWEMARNVRNHSSRSRRTANMGAQVQYLPRALLMISAEQSPDQKHSVLNRVIQMKVMKDQFLSASQEPTTTLRNSWKDTTPQSILNGFIIREIALRAATRGWDAVLRDFDDYHQNHVHEAMAAIGVEESASSQRQVETVADLALGISCLEMAAERLGLDAELESRFLDIRGDLYDTASASYQSAREVNLGVQFLDQLASALASHRVHVALLGQGGMPVAAGESSPYHRHASSTNDRLGWDLNGGGGEPRPCGTRIGDLVIDRRGQPAVVFNPRASFEATGMRAHSANECWNEVIARGFQHPQWKPKPSGGGTGMVQRVTRDGQDAVGVVIPLWRLFGDAPPLENEQDPDA